MRITTLQHAADSLLGGSVETIRLYDPRDKRSQNLAYAGNSLKRTLAKAEFRLQPKDVDLISIMLGILSADYSVPRRRQADGWTRELHLELAVNDPDLWSPHAEILLDAIRFLTTDRWQIQFVKADLTFPEPHEIRTIDAEGVTLLSGGLDSLIGLYEHPGWLPVSQVVSTDSKLQSFIYGNLHGENGCPPFHLKASHGVMPRQGCKEDTQRSRSLFFLSLGVIAAIQTQKYKDGEEVPVMIPENGFIALNPPLMPNRIGAHSTRTAHPYFLQRYEEFVRAAGYRIRIINPYALKTKGEMLQPYQDDEHLIRHAYMTTSCSKFPRMRRQHCGRCVPCQIRRASFLAAGIVDKTKKDDTAMDGWGHKEGYATPNLEASASEQHSKYDDVYAVRQALLEFVENGRKPNSRLLSIISSPAIKNRDALVGVIERGMKELGHLHGLI